MYNSTRIQLNRQTQSQTATVMLWSERANVVDSRHQNKQKTTNTKCPDNFIFYFTFFFFNSKFMITQMFYIETCTFSQSHTVLIEYYSKWVNSNSSLYLLAIWLISSCRAQFFFHKLSSFFTVEQWYFDSFNPLLDGGDGCARALTRELTSNKRIHKLTHIHSQYG